MARSRLFVAEDKTEREAKMKAGSYLREFRLLEGQSLRGESMGRLVRAAQIEAEGVAYKNPESGKVTIIYGGNKALHHIACNAIAERLIYDTDKQVKFFKEVSGSKNIQQAFSKSQDLIDTILSKKLKECRDNVKRLQKYCQKNGLTEEGNLADQLSTALQGSDTLSSLRDFNKALFGSDGKNPSIAQQLQESAKKHGQESAEKDVEAIDESRNPVIQFLKEAVSTVYSSLFGKADSRLSNPMEKVIEDFQSKPRYGVYETIYSKVQSASTTEVEDTKSSVQQDQDKGPTPSTPKGP